MASEFDFKRFLGKAVDDIKRKPKLPRGLWKFLITKQGFGASTKKGTPYVGFTMRPVEPGSDVDPTDLSEFNKAMEDMGLRWQDEERLHECYVTENPNTQVMLREFVEATGVDTQGRAFEEVLPDTIGHQIWGTVVWQQMDNRPGEFREDFGTFHKVTD